MRADNKKFIVAMIMLAIVELLRFFDRTLLFHSAPMGILQNYTFAKILLGIYMIVIMLLFAIMLTKTDMAYQKDMRYLIAFISVFALPMFANLNYFGTMDVVALIIGMIMIGIVCIEKYWIIMPVMSLAMGIICPMSLVTVAALIFALLFYEYVRTNKKHLIAYSIVNILLSLLGLAVSRKMGYFTTDSMYALSLKKFLFVCLLMIPYAIIAIKMMMAILNRAGKKSAYICLFTAGLPAILVYGLLADYSRVIFYGFIYYLFALAVLLIKQDQIVLVVYEEIRERIRARLPFMGLVIAYPFIVMCFWVSGPLELFAETFVGL